MPTYERSLFIPRPVEETFAFVSDFRNAQKWDPRTFRADKVTDGPIGLGTRFVLRGGAVPKYLVPGILSPILEPLLAMPLPYDVVTYTPPSEFVLAGETPVFRYEDRITFAPEGRGTRLTYAAKLEFKGPFAIGNPALALMFKRIGDDATRDIPVTVVEGAARAA
ncbi:MAG: SRPBCC family protein [Archangium sp.]|nr:SRPBCC family protein [Archangium sp.]